MEASLPVFLNIEVRMGIEQNLIDLIGSFSGRLPEDFVTEYISLAEHNECSVALENLCTQLYEFDILLETQELNEIESIGLLLGLGKETWEFLIPTP